MLLTKSDYEALKQTVKGWDRKRLASYGVDWPPIHGWRTKLLREYEMSIAPSWSPVHRLDPGYEADIERMSMRKLYLEKSAGFPELTAAELEYLARCRAPLGVER